jgi:hypothetical protein
MFAQMGTHWWAPHAGQAYRLDLTPGRSGAPTAWELFG